MLVCPISVPGINFSRPFGTRAPLPAPGVKTPGYCQGSLRDQFPTIRHASSNTPSARQTCLTACRRRHRLRAGSAKETAGARFYKGQTGGLLGPEFDCFALDESKQDSLGDKSLAVNSLDPIAGIGADRMRMRRELMERLDRLTDEKLEGPSAFAA